MSLSPDQRIAIIELLKQQSGGELHAFFTAYGYGGTFNALSGGYGRAKRVAYVLTRAQEEGRDEELLLAARANFGRSSTAQGSPVVRPRSEQPLAAAPGTPSSPSVQSSRTNDAFTMTSQGDHERFRSVNAPKQAFIVHGRDPKNRRHEVARFIDRATDLETIMLDEQRNAGRTLIDKLRDYGTNDVIAVVLLTGDDVGRRADTPVSDEKARARQNVILELGYFIALLPPDRTIVLRETDLEVPSDFDGVAYIPLDDGAWRARLTRELAGLDVEVDSKKI